MTRYSRPSHSRRPHAKVGELHRAGSLDTALMLGTAPLYQGAEDGEADVQMTYRRRMPLENSELERGNGSEQACLDETPYGQHPRRRYPSAHAHTASLLEPIEQEHSQNQQQWDASSEAHEGAGNGSSNAYLPRSLSDDMLFSNSHSNSNLMPRSHFAPDASYASTAHPFEYDISGYGYEVERNPAHAHAHGFLDSDHSSDLDAYADAGRLHSRSNTGAADDGHGYAYDEQEQEHDANCKGKGRGRVVPSGLPSGLAVPSSSPPSAPTLLPPTSLRYIRANSSSAIRISSSYSSNNSNSSGKSASASMAARWR